MWLRLALLFILLLLFKFSPGFVPVLRKWRAAVEGEKTTQHEVRRDLSLHDYRGILKVRFFSLFYFSVVNIQIGFAANLC